MYYVCVCVCVCMCVYVLCVCVCMCVLVCMCVCMLTELNSDPPVPDPEFCRAFLGGSVVFFAPVVGVMSYVIE
jgi:hypothetical protein